MIFFISMVTSNLDTEEFLNLIEERIFSKVCQAGNVVIFVCHLHFTCYLSVHPWSKMVQCDAIRSEHFRIQCRHYQIMGFERNRKSMIEIYFKLLFSEQVLTFCSFVVGSQKVAVLEHCSDLIASQ